MISAGSSTKRQMASTASSSHSNLVQNISIKFSSGTASTISNEPPPSVYLRCFHPTTTIWFAGSLITTAQKRRRTILHGRRSRKKSRYSQRRRYRSLSGFINTLISTEATSSLILPTPQEDSSGPKSTSGLYHSRRFIHAGKPTDDLARNRIWAVS